MQTRQALALDQKGVKKFPEGYGEQLFCAPYRYDDQRRTLQLLSNSSSKNPAGLRQRSHLSSGYELISRKLNCSFVSNMRAADGIPQKESGKFTMTR